MTRSIFSIAVARFIKSPLANILVVGIPIFCLINVSYSVLISGWSFPVIPAIFVLAINGIGLTILYQYKQAIKSGIKARQAVIEITVETIHNGPLQSLAKVLRLFKRQDLPMNKLLPEVEKELENLNQELQEIYDFLQREPLTNDTSLYFGNGLVINLQDPIHEILYQVYSHTLERDFPCFKTLKVKIRNFEPIDESSLNIEHKRGLCRFLEESLCNVGKHATGVTRLQVIFSEFHGWYTLSIMDDGLGINSSREGRGTQQLKNLARKIKGKFRRVSVSPRGTICELSWTKTTSFWGK